MRDPITDVLHFLAFQPLWRGNGPAATPWGPIPILLFWVLTLSAIAIGWRNWKTQSGQRGAGPLFVASARYLLGVMWLQQTFWKLPPTFTDNPDGSGGLREWMGHMADAAAFSVHRALVREVVLPNFHFFAYQVWAAETAVAIMLMLGLFARLGALIGLVMSLNLWLGLYNAPGEWSWTYAFMVLLMGFLIATRAGRPLGADAVVGPRWVSKLGLKNSRLARLVDWVT
jgi:thiosulfate dehydrogenase [quinone] large subunit